jgi:MFS family permease
MTTDPAAEDFGPLERKHLQYANLAWGFGFLGFWGPSTTLTAEVFPTRIRGAANGVVWAIAYFVGFVLWPFVTVALQ